MISPHIDYILPINIVSKENNVSKDLKYGYGKNNLNEKHEDTQ